MTTDQPGLPLSGVRVVEFSTMVMGPSCGQILCDLGAEVIKVEPLAGGDRTRHLTGLAAGFFTAYNRGKKSIAVDTRSEEGVAVVHKLLAGCDVVIENFRPGLMKSMKLDYASAKAINPRIVYCSLKGFLPGPYESRTALDEVVQMMGGLAYMTGPPGKPMRAGASINDIMGGMFGVIAIQAALRERDTTGLGQEVQASLYENTAYLMGQWLLAHAINGGEETPVAALPRPWPIYDLMTLSDGSQLFIAVVGDSQWRSFCEAFERPDLLADARLTTNADRAAQRSWLLPVIQETIGGLAVDQVFSRLNAIGLPFAPVRRPSELALDEHLLASGGLIDVDLPQGVSGKMPAIPIMLDGRRPRSTGTPTAFGQDTAEILEAIGLSGSEIDKLTAAGVVGLNS
ncbi:MAG: CaiB/BaiF CoA transferase family protein [Novosphingobium sp.]